MAPAARPSLEERESTMKFTTGAMVGDLSGSIGSTTASHNKFGPYFRSKVIPVNPNTARQQAVRVVFATLVSAWNDSLTAEQRVAWNVWADNTPVQGKDGNPINITGQNAYIRFNVIRLQIGQARVDDGPIIFNNGTPVTSFQDTETGTPGDLGINLAQDAIATTVLIAGGASEDGNLAVYLGAPVNASRRFFKGPYQLADVQDVTDAIGAVIMSTLFIDMTQASELAEFQFRSIRLRLVYDDGRLSEKFEVLADVVAASA